MLSCLRKHPVAYQTCTPKKGCTPTNGAITLRASGRNGERGALGKEEEGNQPESRPMGENIAIAEMRSEDLPSGWKRAGKSRGEAR
jgi:hypothetical protein